MKLDRKKSYTVSGLEGMYIYETQDEDVIVLREKTTKKLVMVNLKDEGVSIKEGMDPYQVRLENLNQFLMVVRHGYNKTVHEQVRKKMQELKIGFCDLGEE